uniref:Pescadillo homolog n=1 Tax=Chaetoceros debilis TaxID=122233 RepID=A0A7S3V5I8_9STRA|mmetsp:Transcript_6165/g.9055  ORF Transcript_6165/g.9055 Transcript_6165/m.9055 type:complete len:691 (+) Transcript_6165:88-2160(+)|eukprot:CAMPEP_0194072526 /NCGR_PEP_ID=MMETSP0149-20130528/251_1 /TAXON_ID=122233 /ORGANISM="Chaetoceros debilis, Strain MM31A-1" /LENGTH=690 /DNA_ID=CAMNT_0038752419 /DNA_START=90 /DNA_END=2162 /DNA_ORIENTATION=-
MGGRNRVQGAPKKKSIKAALNSGVGSKRKLSRFGKKKKKNHAGLDATFIGRSACLRRLHVTLKDFRRLCILKGVYPREPRGKAPSNKKGQVFYHIKDVSALMHEPLLAKFREFDAFMKKVRKCAGRNEKDEAARMDSYAPTYSLHHLVRERYPRFVDAVGDLDDALAMVYLYAALPSTGDVVSKITKKAQALAAEWGAYCSTTSAITKSFVSVKGVYMEAKIQNTNVCWVVPHSFTQNIPPDVDFRVMNTFFEFYETLLGFVMYKLYNDIGVRYPLPVTSVDVSAASSVLSANLQVLGKALGASGGAASNAITEAMNEGTSETSSKKNVSSAKLDKLKTVDEALQQIDDSDDDESMDDDEEVDVAGPLRAALESMDHQQETNIGTTQNMTLDDEATKRKRLLAGLTFFISREVPKGYLELICLSYGGKVGWEGPDSPISIKDPTITHHIVDRPKLPSSFDDLPKSREYIQPQWLIDSANFTFLLPTSRYAVAVELPPHLSPWVDDEEEGYKPAYAEEIECLKNGQPLPESTPNEDSPVEELEASDNEESESDDGNNSSGDKEAEAEESDSSDEGEDEVENEKKLKISRAKRKKSDEEEAQILAQSMMNKKAKRLYGRMQHGIEKKQAAVKILHKRRKEIEICKGKSKTLDGKTMLKAKVDRLKTERRSIEKDYENTGGSMKKKRKKSNKN